MKGAILTIITIFVWLGIVFTRCESPERRIEKAQQKVQDAHADLKLTQQKAHIAMQKSANMEDWKVFKAESIAKMQENDILIAGLNLKMKTSGKTLDGLYATKINQLEIKNQQMKDRIIAYEKTISNWETFKTDFKLEMNELGISLKDLVAANK
jgi:archaellum component FlaF (FlaF/FlaG flagellin family)